MGHKRDSIGIFSRQSGQLVESRNILSIWDSWRSIISRKQKKVLIRTTHREQLSRREYLEPLRHPYPFILPPLDMAVLSPAYMKIGVLLQLLLRDPSIIKNLVMYYYLLGAAGSPQAPPPKRLARASAFAFSPGSVIVDLPPPALSSRLPPPAPPYLPPPP